MGKDLRTHARDRFYMVVTVLGLLVYIGVFWVLPSTTERPVTLGAHLPGGQAVLALVPVVAAMGRRLERRLGEDRTPTSRPTKETAAASA